MEIRTMLTDLLAALRRIARRLLRRPDDPAESLDVDELRNAGIDVYDIPAGRDVDMFARKHMGFDSD